MQPNFKVLDSSSEVTVGNEEEVCSYCGVSGHRSLEYTDEGCCYCGMSRHVSDNCANNVLY